jgi:hypothetical protein
VFAVERVVVLAGVSVVVVVVDVGAAAARNVVGLQLVNHRPCDYYS